ncbi:MAG: hypothetical protein SaIV6_gp2 [Sanya Iflavirus 6]|nr:MAG: hypothetical protein SaIV6_gp2 [Sanya Iflavirus 6]
MLKDNEEAISKILDENMESLDDFDHLRFKIYNNVVDSSKGQSELLTFKQMRVILLKKFRGYHERQIHLFNMAHAAYEKQWEGEEIPHSLKETRDEHRNAMKFLSKYGPKPDVTITEFFRIVRLFSKGTPLTTEDREKIILLYQDSARYQNAKAEEERKKANPPMTPEEKVVEGVVTVNQVFPGASAIAGATANPFVTGYMLGAIGSSAASLVGLLTVWAGGNYYRKYKAKKLLEQNKQCKTIDRSKLTRRQYRALEEFNTLAAIVENKIDFEHSDLANLIYTAEERALYKDKTFLPLDEDSCVAAALMCHPNAKVSRRGRTYEKKDLKKLTLPFSPLEGATIRLFDVYIGIDEDDKMMEDELTYIVVEHIFSKKDDNGVEHFVRDFEILCDCGPFRFCYNSEHWGLFDDLHQPKHLCGCHLLTNDYVWDESKKAFTALDKPDVRGPSCKMEGCEYVTDKSKYKSWVSANYQAVKLGCCPEMLKLGKVKGWLVWLKDECIKKVKSFGKSFWEFISCEFWQLLYRAIVLGFGMFASFWMINKLLELIMPGLDTADLNEPLPPPDGHAYVQVQGSGDIKASKDHFKAVKPSFGKVARLESGYNFNQNTIEIINKIKKNTYILRSPELKQKTGFFGMRVFFIYSNNICFQKHYYELIISPEYKSYTDWELFNPTSGATIPVTPSNWNVKLPKTNQLGYARVTEAPQHRSLLGNIASEKAHEKSFGPCYVVTIDELSCNMISVTPYRQSGVTVSPSEGMSGYITNVVYAYPWSAPGYCGSILLNTNLQQPIIGVHTAGNVDEGYAEPICNTMFSEWLKYQIEEFESDQIAEHLPVSSKLKGNFIPIGKIHPVFTKRESGTSHECPSLVHGEIFPVVSQPAPLSNKDPRMPEGYSPLIFRCK